VKAGGEPEPSPFPHSLLLGRYLFLFGLVVDVRPSEFVCLWQIDVSDRRDTLFGEVCLHLIFKFGGVEVVLGGVVVDQGVQVVCGDGAPACAAIRRKKW